MRSKIDRWHRRIRTTQERRQNQDGWERAKRRGKNLPNSWDDKQYVHTKCWKDHRKTQYRPGKRGEKHTFTIVGDKWRRQYDLKEYFKDHDIPYRIEPIREEYTYRYQKYKRVVLGTCPKYYKRWRWNKETKKGEYDIGHLIGYEDIVDWVKDGYKTGIGWKTVGYNVTWWSDKDIGIQYILKGIE